MYRVQLNSIFFFMRATILNSNEAFREYILRAIRRFTYSYPGRWIKLLLSYNNLGNDVVFFNSLMHDIAKEVHALNIENC